LEEDERGRALVHLLEVGLPQTLRLLAGCLLEVARQQRSVKRARALAAVRELGTAAVSALKLASLQGGDVGLQVQLVELLADLGRTLTPQQQSDVLLHLVILGDLARSKKVKAATAAGVARMKVNGQSTCRETSPIHGL
jgi:hypothetical protein